MRPQVVPLRADKEIVPKETIVGQPLWRLNESTGKYECVETGKEVEVVTMSWEELMKWVKERK